MSDPANNATTGLTPYTVPAKLASVVLTFFAPIVSRSTSLSSSHPALTRLAFVWRSLHVSLVFSIARDGSENARSVRIGARHHPSASHLDTAAPERDRAGKHNRRSSGHLGAVGGITDEIGLVEEVDRLPSTMISVPMHPGLAGLYFKHSRSLPFSRSSPIPAV